MLFKNTYATVNCIVLRWSVAVLFLLASLIPGSSFAHNVDGGPDEDGSEDQLVISLEVKGIGNSDMLAISRNNTIYLPINVIFDFLKIKKATSASLDSMSGFYINEKDAYLIDRIHNRITFRDTVTDVAPGDILKVDDNLYVNLKYFKTIFGLEGVFDFRRMMITLRSGTELPAIQEAEREQMRNNVNKIRGEMRADTTIKCVYPGYHFGTADWGIMSTQHSTGNDDTRLNLGLGAIVAGGELNTSLTFYTSGHNDEKQQFYQWRHVDNNNKGIKQVMIGKIFALPVSTLYAPLVGVMITNASTVHRRAYGTYTLSNHTEPLWVVELYVDGVLADYRKTDMSGFYSFEVPLMYGYSTIKLRFYGPYGEEKTSQQYINVPFNFIPAGEFEYSTSAGIVEDGRNSFFSHGGINYGLSNKITFGGGMESLSSIKFGSIMPFINASVKVAPKMLLSADLIYGVRRRALLSYRLPSSAQLELNYTKYTEGQKAINFNYLEERKAVVSVPIHTKPISLFSRFSVNQILVPRNMYTNLEWTFTGTVKSIGINVSNYASFVGATNPYIYGLFSLSFKLPKKVVFTTQLQYDYKANAPIFIKYTMERRLFGNGYVSASYQDFSSRPGAESDGRHYRNFMLSMRYDLSFVKLAASASVDNDKGYTRVEYASGSLLYDRKTQYLNANNKTNVGKGVLVVIPYLDLNCNGTRDAGEPRVENFRLNINGGRVVYNDKDTLIQVFDMEPYANYYLDLSKNSFDNISWRIRNRTIRIAVSPNNFTTLEIPVAVLGEVSGTVFMKGTSDEPEGLQKVIVNIYDSSAKLVGRTISESDGFFSYVGLAPGSYTLQLDSDQLQKLHLIQAGTSLPIRIQQTREGDVADALEFTVEPDRNYPLNKRAEKQ